MSKTKDYYETIKELKNTAIFNREKIRFKTIIANINGSDYSIRISGVGQKSIKLDVYLSYDQIHDFKDEKKLEKELYDIINTVYD